MAQTVAQVLQQGNFTTDDTLYSLIHLPPNAITAAAGILAQIGEPFGALIADKGEVTLVIPTEVVADYAARLRENHTSDTTYRLITFDLELEPALTGFMAAVSTALAAADVPILPLAAFSRDHLLVPSARFDAAWQALDQLKRNGQA